MITIPKSIDSTPNLRTLVEAVVEAWPEHMDFIGRRFNETTQSTLPLSERLAELILRLAGDELDSYVAGYRWMCEAYLIEDLYFRRHGHYRLNSFAEAEAQIYSQKEYMGRYLKGILVTRVLWTNEIESLDFFINRFLPQLPEESEYLEIGPAHGLLMYFAASTSAIKGITGWDVSESSLAATRRMLTTMGLHKFELTLQDILKPTKTSEAFDAVVLSEVLEHLERPDNVLRTIHRILRPGGRLYLNVPVNSPAPDHIFLWSHPDQIEELVRNRGFTILDSGAAAMTGYTVDMALRRKANINALIVAERK